MFRQYRNRIKFLEKHKSLSEEDIELQAQLNEEGRKTYDLTIQSSPILTSDETDDVISVNKRRFERLNELWFGEGPNLNAGCGSAGTALNRPFINLDIEKYESWDTKPHFIFEVGDARNLKYPDNHFDVIYTSDVVEHFTISDAVKVIKEFYRTLKTDGCLKMIVPDFGWGVKLYIATSKYKDYDQNGGLLAKKGGVVHGRMGPIWSIIYGQQRSSEEGYSSEHFTVWDEELLRYYLQDIGFKDIERVYDKLFTSYPHTNDRDLVMEAWK